MRPRVIIIGGGFGGLYAARALRNAPVDVTVIDRTNHHVFQPLLYQVATAALSPADIAEPIRKILHRYRSVQVVLGEVERVDRETREVVLREKRRVPYDVLVRTIGAWAQDGGRRASHPLRDLALFRTGRDHGR
jgi:NADH dehydrogenase